MTSVGSLVVLIACLAGPLGAHAFYGRAADCQDGFTQLCDSGSCNCYAYVTFGMPWESARDFCSSQYGAELASIHSETANQLLWGLIPADSNPNGIWIGAKRNPLLPFTFSWTDGTCFDYGDFQAGSPDNINDSQDCIRLIGQSDVDFESPHKWDDYACTALYASFCQISSGGAPTPTGSTTVSPTGSTTAPTGSTSASPGGTTVLPNCEAGWTPFCHIQGCHCYTYVDAKMAWTLAESHCSTAYNSHLASIHSDDENKFLHDWMVGTGETYVYIGLNNRLAQYDVWAWSDGTEVNYEKWGPNEPSCPGGCHAASFYYTYEGWNDQLETNPQSFFCKKLP